MSINTTSTYKNKKKSFNAGNRLFLIRDIKTILLYELLLLKCHGEIPNKKSNSTFLVGPPYCSNSV